MSEALLAPCPALEKQPVPCVTHCGKATVKALLEAFEPCVFHGSIRCNCPKRKIGVHELADDLATQQFAQLIQLNILNTAETIKDTSGSTHAESVNTASTTVTVLAGTSGTAATVTDNALGTQTETQSATINVYSGSGSSGSFTVTATITASSARAYQEVGLRVTVNTHLYLICRDTFSTLNVSSGGTLAVTYTFTLT